MERRDGIEGFGRLGWLTEITWLIGPPGVGWVEVDEPKNEARYPRGTCGQPWSRRSRDGSPAREGRGRAVAPSPTRTAEAVRSEAPQRPVARPARVAVQLALTRTPLTLGLDLTLLAPSIQERVLAPYAVEEREPMSERALRPIAEDLEGQAADPSWMG